MLTLPRPSFTEKMVSPPTRERGVGVEVKVKAVEEKVVKGSPLEEPLTTRDSEVGCRLQRFSSRWAFSPWAQNILAQGLGWEWIRPPPPRKSFFQKETPLLLDFVQTMLEEGAIEKCRNLSFQGRLFDLPRKDSDKRRQVLDLSPLNICIR